MTFRILLMDDEPSICEITGILLRKLGYDPIISRNSTEALDAFKKARDEGNPVDLAILDLSIPGDIGGKEVIRMLKELDPDVKALVSSGDLSDEAVISYNKFGFSGVLAKPYNKAGLDEAIRKMLP